jgi:hypothetical protein
MPQDNYEQRPVKEKREEPEPFGAGINRALIVEIQAGVSEKRTEEENLERHPADDSCSTRRAFQIIALDPGQ